MQVFYISFKLVATNDFTGHYPHTEMNGIEGVRNMVGFIRGAFPDWQEELKDIVIGEEKVVIRFIGRGTHNGYILDMAPTGNRVDVEEIAIFKVRDKKIAEQWGVFDSYRMMDQLGTIKRS